MIDRNVRSDGDVPQEEVGDREIALRAHGAQGVVFGESVLERPRKIHFSKWKPY